MYFHTPFLMEFYWHYCWCWATLVFHVYTEAENADSHTCICQVFFSSVTSRLYRGPENILKASWLHTPQLPNCLLTAKLMCRHLWQKCIENLSSKCQLLNCNFKFKTLRSAHRFALSSSIDLTYVAACDLCLIFLSLRPSSVNDSQQQHPR